MNKHEIASLFNEIATLLELKGENPFKIRAYLNGARALENLEEELDILVKEERLEEVPGIGAHLAEKISTLVSTGHLPYYDELKGMFPDTLFNLFGIPGLGGKKIKVLYETLGIKSFDDLEQACKKGLVATIPHFGEKTQSKILEGLKKFKEGSRRFLWWSAMDMAKPILSGLSHLPYVKRVEIAGSVRRKMETVGDLDFLVASSHPQLVMEWFTTQDWVEEILGKGMTKSSIIV
jgi:DNA polymerase (family 10)